MLTVGEGVAEAPLVGGCLTLLCASIGTPFEVQTDGCVLMVEDLNTDEYLVDTALNHLIRAGKLDNAAGFVFGTNVNLQAQTTPGGIRVDALDRGGPRRADRSARDPRDRERAGRPRQAHGDHAAGGDGAPRRRREDPGSDRGGGSRTTMRRDPDEAQDDRGPDRDRRGARRGDRSGAPGRRPGRRRKKKVLKIGWAQDAQTLNPFVAQDEENFRIWALNWDLLVNFSPDDLSPAPGIAESWDVSKDKKTVTFHLIEGAKWSDGEPITSKDVKYSLEMLGTRRPDLHRLHVATSPRSRRPDDQHRRDPHQAAGRAHRRRPVRLHHPGARLRQGAAQRADRLLPAEAAAGRQRAVHRHRVRARPDPDDGAQPELPRREARRSTRSSSSSTGRPTPSSGRCSSARST